MPPPLFANTIQAGEKLGWNIPVKLRTIEWRHDIPAGVVEMAQRRTRDMLAHYGRNITAMPIETLVASCYLQGIEDCFYFQEKRADR